MTKRLQARHLIQDSKLLPQKLKDRLLSQLDGINDSQLDKVIEVMSEESKKIEEIQRASFFQALETHIQNAARKGKKMIREKITELEKRKADAAMDEHLDNLHI